MSEFLHDLSNLVGIIQGKIKQAERLLLKPNELQHREEVLCKLRETLLTIEKTINIIRSEKIEHQKNQNSA